MTRIATSFFAALVRGGTLEVWSAVVAGAICGLAGCVPPAFLLEGVMSKGIRVNIATGLASIIVPFVMLSVAVLVVYLVASEATLVFGCSMAAAFLAVWAVESLRAWRDANGSPKGRKEG